MIYVARHVIFSGTVQGVGFRYTSCRIARQYKLAGFVRNLPDGAVEMLVEGRGEDVGVCISQIKECFDGYISRAEVKDVEYDSGYTDFSITYF